MSRILYGFPLSGNTHRVRLFLSLLGLEYREQEVSLVTGEHRRPDFLALNPLGQVPVLVEGELVLRDSHAIVYYLARTHDRDAEWLPREPAEASRVLQWLFMDANELHNGIGYARNHVAFGVACDLAAAQARARSALQVLEGRLVGERWLELGRPTLADVACYPLVSLSHQGGVPLGDYPSVAAWVKRVEALAGFVKMPKWPTEKVGEGG
ncbi:glutathione S-transferase family protein [Myxococcus stipitatus]|uniref:glutathione S-transferase family protein n=1 Tax=Myxococcus stipitatus TaxID=83455 RepID=UPI001F23CDB0|nr:glutathione S-transferase family protein [Myxococcus stipitatus]MCE9670555.1 glutathione S-transferase family protein [Myxococcus stipitatus]